MGSSLNAAEGSQVDAEELVGKRGAKLRPDPPARRAARPVCIHDPCNRVMILVCVVGP